MINVSGERDTPVYAFERSELPILELALAGMDILHRGFSLFGLSRRVEIEDALRYFRVCYDFDSKAEDPDKPIIGQYNTAPYNAFLATLPKNRSEPLPQMFYGTTMTPMF